MNRRNDNGIEEEFDNIIYSYIQNRLFPTTTTTTATSPSTTTTQPIHTTSTTIPPSYSANANIENRLNMLYNIVNNYNSNMQTYQYNIGSLINLIEQCNRELTPHSSYYSSPEYQTQENNQQTLIPNPNYQESTSIPETTSQFESTNYSNDDSSYNGIRSIINRNRQENSSNNPVSLEYILYYYPSNVRRDTETDNLTQEQINNCVRDISYTELCNETICPITLENFIIGETISQIIPCNHIFKKSGLIYWLSRNIKCPVCRYDLRSYNQVTETAPFTNNTYYNNHPNGLFNDASESNDEDDEYDNDLYH